MILELVYTVAYYVQAVVCNGCMRHPASCSMQVTITWNERLHVLEETVTDSHN